MPPGLRINRPHPDEFLGPHAAGRPNKRQCNNDHLRSHDLTANRPAQRSPSRRPSLESSQSSRTVERGFLPKQHEEFRGVEDSVQIPKSFQRSKGNRSIPRKQGLTGGFLDEEDLRPVLPPPKNRSAIDLEANSSRGDAMSPNSSKVTPNSSSSRESPDVLQGGVTTKQSPRHIHSQQNHVSHNTNSDFLPSPSRKRSPTDIRPTDFASSPLQGPKRAKRSHGSSKSFDVKCINIGGKDHPGGKLVYRPEPKRLEFFGNTRTSEYDYLKILVRTIATVVLGDDQSSKAILKSSRDINSSVLNVGIEFTKILEKDNFATLIRKDDAKIINRSMAYMDNVFNRFGTGTNAPSQTSKKPLIESVSSEPSQEAPVSSTRQKLSSALQGDLDDSKKEGETPNKR